MNWSEKKRLKKSANIRDNFKCVDCGKTKSIETHHVVPELEELNNLVTLCHACHKKRHGYSGCFKRGFDSRRAITHDNAGNKNLIRLNQKRFYNTLPRKPPFLNGG